MSMGQNEVAERDYREAGYDDRTERAEVVKRMPHMPEAMEMLERAVDRLQKEGSMLEERLSAGYLSPPRPEADRAGEPERELVPMAEAVKRLAWRVERAAAGLSDVRERFEG